MGELDLFATPAVLYANAVMVIASRRTIEPSWSSSSRRAAWREAIAEWSFVRRTQLNIASVWLTEVKPDCTSINDTSRLGKLTDLMVR